MAQSVFALIHAMTPPPGALSIERMCALTGVSRASYYRHWREVAPRREEIERRDVLQRLAIAHRHYGYRRVVPNLARGMQVTGLDHLWVADITYVRLLEEFVFLAVVLDAFSRRVVGWALEEHLRPALTGAALQMALAARCPVPGLV